MINKLQAIVEALEKDNVDIIHAWAAGKLVRSAAFHQLQATACAVTHTTGLSMREWMCPGWMWHLLKPHLDGEGRVLRPDGGALVRRLVDSGGGSYTQTYAPHGWADTKWPVLNLTLDHCTVGSSGAYYLLSQQYLLHVSFDWFHELWNNVKNAAKRTQKGCIWHAILGFMVIANYNHGPFRSGAWFQEKKELLKLYMATHTAHSTDFQEVVAKIAKDFGNMPCQTAEEQSQVFEHMRALRSFNEKGPTLKLQRWGSINEAWQWYEPELRASKLVLSASSHGRDAAHAAPLQAGSGEVFDIGNMKKTLGTVELVPKLLTEELFCHMRIFSTVTAPIWTAHGSRAMYVKTPKLGLISAMADARGGWQTLLRKTVHASLFHHGNLGYMGFAADCVFDDGQLAAKVFDFLCGFLNARSQSQVLAISSFPEATVLALSETPGEATATLQKMRAAWETLLWAEGLACKHDGMRAVLSAVPWCGHAIPRLIFLLAESEGWQLPAAKTRELLKNVHQKLPDTKVIEDMHQHIRDKSRLQRYKKVSRPSRMQSCIESGVLEGRSLPCVTVPKSAIRDAPPSIWQQPSKHLWECQGDVVPSEWAAIMLPNRSWPSPSPMGLFRGAAAWEWLLHYKSSGLLGQVPLTSAWLSKLLPPRAMVRDAARTSSAPFLVVISAEYGALVWRLSEHTHPDTTVTTTPANCFKLSVGSDVDNIQWQFVTRLSEFQVLPYKPLYVAGVGIVLARDGEPISLVQAALLNHVSCTKDELLELIRLEPDVPPLDLGQAATVSKPVAMRHLCRHVLDPSTPDFDNLVDSLCQAPETADEHLVSGCAAEYMADLVDEIMVQDMDNASEVKQIKTAISNKLRRNLAELKEHYDEKQKAEAAGRTKRRGRPPKPKGKARGKADLKLIID